MLKRFLTIALAFVLFLSLAGLNGCQNKQTSTEQPAPVDLVRLEEDYLTSLTDILTNYQSRSADLTLDLVTKTQSDVLDLVVPGSYKNFHLNLVLSLNAVRQGLELNDQSKVTAGQADLDKLMEQILN
ncbi:MAG TPA: hypothetical protein VGA49_03685 [Patescibacteria group bacterium]